MKKSRLLLLVLLCPVILAGCDKDKEEEPDDRFNGTVQSIEEFLTPELTEIMTELGMQLYTGNEPPNIEGEYFAMPILEATNVPGDVIGSSFNNSVLKFEEQNNDDLSVKFSYDDQQAESGEGIGALIAGKNNLFSAFLKMSSKLNGSPYESVMVISGSLESEGIANFKWALFSLENYGNSGILENGQGRIFIDKDNIAVRTTANGKLKLEMSGNSKTMMGK